MIDPAQIFPENARDAFLEIANIGIGRAANAMSELVERQVTIEVPRLECADNAASGLINELGANSTVHVSQGFSGEISGEAILVLGKPGAMSLASLLLEDIDMGDAFGDTVQGAILELGNIMIGGLVGSLSNAANIPFSYEVPQIHLKGTEPIGKDFEKETFMVIIKAQLTIDTEDVTSFLVLVLPVEDFKRLTTRIGQLD